MLARRARRRRPSIPSRPHIPPGHCSLDEREVEGGDFGDGWLGVDGGSEAQPTVAPDADGGDAEGTASGVPEEGGGFTGVGEDDADGVAGGGTDRGADLGIARQHEGDEGKETKGEGKHGKW